ncbi:MAG TPA: hypothetical protein DDW94_05160 [Deltaproteobacteria bacterium]|nr:MAG: hypothetical protein A2Z79_11130 [Deltaproteobacteria bacterium GWA2_55_82]OGQ64410.1 MAG: hypothetical protein A3I81_02935 [Deltaproteobacteria bacterium RIFCSPLOWO2_02_FULL_55_12]OIJ72790.1 MAG: hypothetical protein A2V21_300075 [Deltaproteobacteria bacterium GWC2_55_46]HBG46362.1 hypothetical protein [Deltaproteobacteria bacterium]HCY11563.1 hypothetical protein [Deltaproteobacteria bacterium]
MAHSRSENGKSLRPAHVAIAVAIVVIISNFIFSGTVLKGQEIKAAELEMRAGELRAAVSGKGSGLYDVARTESFINGLPESKDLTRILDETFQSARQHDLVVHSADYSPESRDGSFSRYSFAFPVEGSYKDIKKFLYDIETSRRPIAIDEVNLASGKAGDSRIVLKLRMSVYYR